MGEPPISPYSCRTIGCTFRPFRGREGVAGRTLGRVRRQMVLLSPVSWGTYAAREEPRMEASGSRDTATGAVGSTGELLAGGPVGGSLGESVFGDLADSSGDLHGDFFRGLEIQEQWWFFLANMPDHVLFPAKQHWAGFPVLARLILWEASE